MTSLTTSNSSYRMGYQPLMPGVVVAPYPYAFRYGWTPEQTSAICLRERRHLLATQTAPQETAAILVEPVLGEGCFVSPPAAFLSGVEQICHEHDILLIVDEVQTGFGRTGRWFAHQHFGVVPDMLIMAKGLASGFPLSGIATRSQLMQDWSPGSHGGTYGGNAVCCAAAVATIQVIREEGLIENCAAMGQYLMSRLRELQRKHSVIGDVRGLGLMVGTEMVTVDGQPDPAIVQEVKGACLHEGLILISCGTYGNIVRWLPPLTVNRGEIDQALDVFDKELMGAGH